MLRSLKGSMLTRAACRGEMHTLRAQSLCLPALFSPLYHPPVSSSSFILFMFLLFWVCLTCHLSSFSCLPLSFLFIIILKIIPLLAFFFLSLLWPPSPPPSLSLLPSISVPLLFFPTRITSHRLSPFSMPFGSH